MGYWYQLAPTSAKFVREVEDMAPEALDAYILEKYPDAEPEHPFLWRLFRTPQIYLGGAAPMEAFQYGKPLFNRPETQDVFARVSPYVVNRRSVGVLIDWWYAFMKEEENDRKARNNRGNNAKWVRERLRLLRIAERRCPLYILYVT
jgi:hypothetical protein